MRPLPCCLGELVGAVEGGVVFERGDDVAELADREVVSVGPVLPSVEGVAVGCPEESGQRVPSRIR